VSTVEQPYEFFCMRIKIDKSQWESLKKEFDYRCVRCGLGEYNLERDHIIPFYQGGAITIENIQPLCAWCNSSKGPETTNWKQFRREVGWLEIKIRLPSKHPFNL